MVRAVQKRLCVGARIEPVALHDRNSGQYLRANHGRRRHWAGGVTISAGATTTTTGSDGTYTLSNLSAGTYTVSAARTGYGFSPGSRSVTLPPNATTVDFVGAEVYEVSGRITDADNIGIGGVTVSAGASQATTDATGNYHVTGIEAGTVNLTPAKPGYTFCPRSRTLTVPPNPPNKDYTGALAGSVGGFCPEPDGFGFANKQLWRTWPMFEQFYGADQMHKPDGSICGEAQQYFEQAYRGVADGWSCVGFTLGSWHSYQSRPQPNAGPFAMAHYDRLYDQPESGALADPIAYYSGVQLSQHYQSEYQSWLATCDTDPTQMVERLRQALQAGSPLLLSLNAGSVYHAVAPYRLVDGPAGETQIYVYDSEAPGQPQVVRLPASGGGLQWQYTFTGSLASAGTRTGGCRDMFYTQAATSLERGAPLVNLCEDARGARAAEPIRARPARAACSPCCRQQATGSCAMRPAAGWAGRAASGSPRSPTDTRCLRRSATQRCRSAVALPAGGTHHGPGECRVGSQDRLQPVCRRAGAGGARPDSRRRAPSARSASRLAWMPSRWCAPAGLTSLVVDVTHELPTASRVAGLAASAIAGNDDLALSFDGQAMRLSRAGGGLAYRVRFFQPGRRLWLFRDRAITLGADEAHRLVPTNWNGLTASSVTLEIDEGRNGTIDETVTLENAARRIYLPVVRGS